VFILHFRLPLQTIITRSFNALPASVASVAEASPATAVSPWNFQSLRTKGVRNYFPRPREVKRYKCHSWWYRLRTTNGKKLIMKRMLKGRHSLAPGW